jgi:lipoate-protein ligase A
MLIAESQSLDVYRNLAIEEYLMDRVQDCGPVLFLWRSSCAVVVGKNQNPWRECRLDRMEQDGVPLARRISGGGTVYHDAGNLNYCVITSREEYREEKAYEMVFQAFEPLGIRAEKTGTSNLSVNGLKFSGNAFAFRKGRALHHGTLLLQTDLPRLGRYLGSMIDGIETHAIASVPARVANLGVDLETVSLALKKSFQTLYEDGIDARWTDKKPDETSLEILVERQVSDVWRYGATPRFYLEAKGLRMEVAHGNVVDGPFVGKPFKDVAFSLLC